MSGIFNTFFYQPLINILITLYQLIPGGDLGLAIIGLTAFIRIILYPISAKGIRSQKRITELQPEIKEIQEKYKDNKEKQAQEMLETYKKANISPFSGFVPLLIQLPVMIALYRALWVVQSGDYVDLLYKFIPHPGEINSIFLGMVDLAKVGIFDNNRFLIFNAIVIFAAGFTQFYQMKMVTKAAPKKKKKSKDPAMEMAEKMQNQMVYFFPLFTIFILFKLPLAIGLYWLVSTIFSIIQQYIILKEK